MTSARFAIQAALVLALVVLVSWPEPQGVRGASLWRQDGPLALARRAAAGDPRRRGLRYEIGYGSYALSRASAAMSSSDRRRFEQEIERRRRRPIPESVTDLGARLNAILGRARSSMNAAVPYARLVLRNLATGQVEANATADEQGQFAFLDVLPSEYIVEMIGADGAVSATSEPVIVDIGDLRRTTVRAAGSRALLGSFGPLAASANEAVDTAVRDGVTAVSAPERTISPQR
jgi:hypothetical protein